MDSEIAELRRALKEEKRRGLEQYQAVSSDARAALRMIREVVELYAPSGSMPTEKCVTAEAEVLVRGILAIARAKEATE